MNARDRGIPTDTPAVAGVRPPVRRLPAAQRSAADPPAVRYAPWIAQWAVLVPAIGVLLISGLLTVRGQRQVIVPWLNKPLPGTCTFHRLTGWDCPGCGLTRSFVSLAHGQLRQSFRFHSLGVVLFLVVVFQLPYRLWQLRRLARGQPVWRRDWMQRWGIWLLTLLLLVHWIVRFIIA